MIPSNELTQSWQSLEFTKTKLLVVACTGHLFAENYVESFEVKLNSNKTITCQFTSDTTLASQADALWFHYPARGRHHFPDKKKPGQKWILASMESNKNYTQLEDPEFLKFFDLLMTYQLDADIPMLYPTWHEYDNFNRPPVSIETKNKSDAIAVYIASNPIPHRDDLVRALMEYIPVDSLGSCLNNKSSTEFVTGHNHWARGGWNSVLDHISHYKFYLALENSITYDYATERVFHALCSGTVPIYLGAPNIRDFLPDDNAIINVTDFYSVKDLAEYLQHLNQNDQAYTKHLKWKTSGYSASFKKLIDIASIDPRHRMAVKMAHNCADDCSCGGKSRH